jgi:hypothetical protein
MKVINLILKIDAINAPMAVSPKILPLIGSRYFSGGEIK